MPVECTKSDIKIWTADMDRKLRDATAHAPPYGHSAELAKTARNKGGHLGSETDGARRYPLSGPNGDPEEGAT